MNLVQISSSSDDIKYGSLALETDTKGYYIYVTEACNLRCSYCFVNDKMNNRHMSDEMIQKVVDFIVNDPAGRQSKYIHFFGGEPLIRADIVSRIHGEITLRLDGKCKITWGITTNGTLLTEKNCTMLKSRGIGVQLSLDGSEEGNDVHRQLMGGDQSSGNNGGTAKRSSGAYKLVKIDNYFKYFGDNARMTVTPGNVEFLHKSVTELHDRGFKSFSIVPDPESDWSPEYLSRLERQLDLVTEDWNRHKNIVCCDKFEINFIQQTIDDILKRQLPTHLCQAGRTVIGITVDGEIYPCHDFAGKYRTNPAERQKLMIGHIDHGHTSNVSKFSDMQVDSTIISGAGHDCNSCAAKYACHKGCPYINYATENNIRVVNRNACEFTRIYTRIALGIIARSDDFKIFRASEVRDLNKRIKDVVAMIGDSRGSVNNQEARSQTIRP